MHTDGIGVERHHGAVDCHHLMLAHHAQHARRHFGRIGDHCIRQTARHQRAVRVVRAVGERLVEHTKPGLRGQAADHGARLRQYRQRCVHAADSLDHGGGLRFVADDPVVQRAMRFHVPHLRADRPRHAFQRGDLVHHVRLEFVGGLVHIAAPESGQVAVRHMRPDHYPPRRRV